MPLANADAEYAALTAGAGVVDCSERTQLEITGDDRATLLHNLTTNAVRGLTAGDGCESFALDVRGHVVGHFFVFCTPHSLVIDGVPSQAERLLAHFERYHVREQVEFHDRSGEWGELLVAGANAGTAVERVLGAAPERAFGHREISWAGGRDTQKVWLRRVDLVGPGNFLIATARESLPRLQAALREAGVLECGPTALETARIEAGFPWYGVDITDKNLPQEVGRDGRAISFTKGCYLGQETVARIDALGHVNRTLVGVRFAGSEIPEPGDELAAGEGAADAAVGIVTSATLSPRLNAPLALAYVRRGLNVPGAKLRWRGGDAEVVALPIASHEPGVSAPG